MKVTQGFTFLETTLILVVVILLIAVIVPTYQKQRRLKFQHNARKSLFILYQLQKKYLNENKSLATKTEALHFASEVKNDPYTYKIDKTNLEAFQISAMANLDRDETLDMWTIDEKGVLTPKSNDILE